MKLALGDNHSRIMKQLIVRARVPSPLPSLLGPQRRSPLSLLPRWRPNPPLSGRQPVNKYVVQSHETRMHRLRTYAARRTNAGGGAGVFAFRYVAAPANDQQCSVRLVARASSLRAIRHELLHGRQAQAASSSADLEELVPRHTNTSTYRK